MHTVESATYITYLRKSKKQMPIILFYVSPWIVAAMKNDPPPQSQTATAMIESSWSTTLVQAQPILALALAILVAVIHYVINVARMDRRRSLMDVGFKSIRSLSHPSENSDAYVKRHIRSRKLGQSLKPPYPNGWTVVAESRDVSVDVTHSDT